MRQHRRALFAFGVAVCAGIAGAVPGDPVGGEFRANTRAEGFQGTPTVSMAPDGRFSIAWLGDSGEGWIVWRRAFTASGVPQDDGAGELGVGYPSDALAFPAMATNPYDQAFLAWSSLDDDGRGVLADLPGGAGTVQVNETTAGNQGGAGLGPAVAADLLGTRYVVVWGSEQAGGYGAYARLFAADGQPSGPEFQVSTRPTLAVASPSVEMADNGDFVVVWSGSTAEDSYAILARRYDGSGVPLGDEFEVSGELTEPWHGEPDVAMDADGRFVVTWQTKAQANGPTAVRARRYAAAGTPLGGEITVTDDSLPASHSAVAMIATAISPSPGRAMQACT